MAVLQATRLATRQSPAQATAKIPSWCYATTPPSSIVVASQVLVSVRNAPSAKLCPGHLRGVLAGRAQVRLCASLLRLQRCG